MNKFYVNQKTGEISTKKTSHYNKEIKSYKGILDVMASITYYQSKGYSTKDAINMAI